MTSIRCGAAIGSITFVEIGATGEAEVCSAIVEPSGHLWVRIPKSAYYRETNTGDSCVKKRSFACRAKSCSGAHTCLSSGAQSHPNSGFATAILSTSLRTLHLLHGDTIHTFLVVEVGGVSVVLVRLSVHPCSTSTNYSCRRSAARPSRVACFASWFQPEIKAFKAFVLLTTCPIEPRISPRYRFGCF
jgi:hypothetical protein